MSTQIPTHTPLERIIPTELANSLQEAHDASRTGVVVSASATTHKVAEPIVKLNPAVLKWWSDHLGPMVPAPQVQKALPPIDLSWAPITFPDGTPVGGRAHVTLKQDGTARFTGHLHDSGAPSYTDQLAFIISTGNGTAFTLSHSGEMHGTFESGSRNDDWDETTNNAALKAAFARLGPNPSWHAKASVNWDIAAMVDELKTVVGVVETVIALF